MATALLKHELQMNQIEAPEPPDSDKPTQAAISSRDLARWRVAREDISVQLACEWDELSAMGVASPYQSRSWVMHFLNTAARAAGDEPALMTIRDAQGLLLGLFPLALKMSKKGHVASFVGGKHANYHMPLLRDAFADSLTPKICNQLMLDIAQKLPGLDAFVLINQPRRWNDKVPPLVALAAWNALQPAYALSLRPNSEAAMERSMSTHARKSLRSKRRKLEELGKISLFQATTEGEIKIISDKFKAQKAARFADLGITDPFAEPGVIEMLCRAALAGDDHKPGIVWHALMLNERMIAIFIGAVDHRRYSGMATSFTADDDVAKHSPGEALIFELIKDQESKGRTIFDLGVGEARYKTSFCDVTEAMCESVLPMTAKGYFLLAGLQLKRMAREFIFLFGKRYPTMIKALRTITRL